nr:MAG TPA: hypothetical protein [Caudoviricetes sp.]
MLNVQTLCTAKHTSFTLCGGFGEVFVEKSA